MLSLQQLFRWYKCYVFGHILFLALSTACQSSYLQKRKHPTVLNVTAL